MVLAAFGTEVMESTLEAAARLDPHGTEIGELERLSREFGLVADIREVAIEELRQLLAEEKLAMAYIDRAAFDLSPAQRARHSLRAAKMHVVIPTRITAPSRARNSCLHEKKTLADTACSLW